MRVICILVVSIFDIIGIIDIIRTQISFSCINVLISGTCMNVYYRFLKCLILRTERSHQWSCSTYWWLLKNDIIQSFLNSHSYTQIIRHTLTHILTHSNTIMYDTKCLCSNKRATYSSNGLTIIFHRRKSQTVPAYTIIM